MPQGTVIRPFDLVAAFTPTPSAPLANQTVLFDASASTGSIVDYAWEFGDGGRGSGRTAQHAYSTAGTYVARLTISDGFGRSANAVQSITVGAGLAPTASFTFSPAAPLPGTTVFFNASASRPAPGRTLSGYQWDFGDGASGTGVQPNHAYALAGTYTVTLSVTDDVGRTGTVSQSVSVGIIAPPAPPPAAPTASFTFSPAAPPRLTTVFFNAAASQPASGRTLVSYQWDFGDGFSGTGVQSTHVYQLAGTYTVTLIVTDDAGRTGLVSRPVTIVP